MTLVLGGRKTRTSPHPPGRVLKVYRGLSGVKSPYLPDGLNSRLLSQGYVLETAPCVGMMVRIYIPRTREPPIAWI